MHKFQLLILATFIAVAFAESFTAQIEKNKKFVADFWSGDIVTGTERCFNQQVVESDVIPFVWDGPKITGSYVARKKGKALMLSQGLFNTLNSGNCQATCKKLRSLLVSEGTATVIESTAYFAQPEAKRTPSQIVFVQKTSKGFKASELYAAWEAGTVPALVFLNQGYLDETSEYSELSYLLGIFTSRSSMRASPQSNLTFEPTADLMPYGLTIEAWIEDMKNILTYPQQNSGPYVKFENYPGYLETLYQFILKYDSVMEQKPVTSRSPISTMSKNHPYTIEFFKAYATLSFSQALKNIAPEKLSKLTFQYGTVGGYLTDSTIPEPTVGEFVVSMNSKGNLAIPAGVSQKPHSIIEYEVLNGVVGSIGAGVLTDNLSGKTSLRRVPIARSAESMVFGKTGTFYSPIGGPIMLGTGSAFSNFTIKFKNVFRTPGINTRDPSTSALWDSGAFKNTRARFAQIICDVIFISVEMSILQSYDAKRLEEICNVHDYIVKSFSNFVAVDITRRDRYHVVFDPQPSAGAAHSGQPIVCSQSWSLTLNGMANYYYRKTDKRPYWGMLHEIGHMFQPNAWKFGVFGETTNNVLGLMFLERYFNATWEDRNFHPAVMNLKPISQRLNGNVAASANVWAGLHFHYHLVPSFGWALYGNVYHRYTKENNYRDISFDRFLRYISQECGYNLVPYAYYFRFGFLFRDMMAVYKELSNLPTYKPYDRILELATDGWNETKTKFGFTNDVQVVKILPFKFDPDQNMNKMDPISPIIQQL